MNALLCCLMLLATSVAEIAAHLPVAPTWAGPDLKAGVTMSRTIWETPLPACSDELYQLYNRTGNRNQYEHEAAYRLHGIIYLTNELCKDPNKKEVREKLIEYLSAILSERSWVYPAHDRKGVTWEGKRNLIDLGSSARAEGIAFTLAKAGSRLPPELVARARAELERRIFAPYRELMAQPTPKEALRFNFWVFGRNNWNAVCHCGCVRAALAVLENPRDRAAFIELASRGMPHYLDGFLADGYCTEGMGYWNFGYGHFIDLTLAVREATGGFVDFSKLPRANASVSYALNYRLSNEGGCPDFADGGGSAPNATILEHCYELWPELKPAPNAKLPPATWFPCAQVYIGRGNRLAFAMKGGNNDEMHNHNDLGSWSLVVDGLKIAGDPGGETYTRDTFSPRRYASPMNGSFGHPVPKVNDCEQTYGPDYVAKVVSTNFTPSVDTVVLDLSKAYQTMVEGKLGSLMRKMAFDHKQQEVTIVDFAKFKRAIPFESVFIARGEVKIAPDQKSFTVTKQGKKGEEAKILVKLGVKADTPGHLEQKSIENPKKETFTRLAYVFDQPLTSAQVGWRISVKE